MNDKRIALTGTALAIITLLGIAYLGGSREQSEQQRVAHQRAALQTQYETEVADDMRQSIKSGNDYEAAADAEWHAQNDNTWQQRELKRLEAEDKAALSQPRK